MQQGQEQISDGQVAINFPSGFNKDNAIIVSIGAKNINNNFWGYGSITEYAGSYNASLIEKGVTFRANDMLLHLQCDGLNVGGNATTTRTDTYEYKIVLMKLPKLTEGIDYTLGDVNSDGVIDNNDLKLVQNYIQGIQALTDIQLKAADVNKDGKIDTGDTFKLSQHINGIIDSF